MEEPHQRTRSGKLRKSWKAKNTDGKSQGGRSTEVKIGVENATFSDYINPDDETTNFMQTPTCLTDFQVGVLEDITENLEIRNCNAIDRNWRQTWNLGAWFVGNALSISANMIQPNIAVAWINYRDVNPTIISETSNFYLDQHLENSSCSIKESRNLIETKGRWTPFVLDSLLSRKLIHPDQAICTYLNVTQSRLFFWILVDKDNEFFCTVSKDTLNLISRYLPQWSFDVSETSAGGNLSIKLRSTLGKNDSSQLSVATNGWLQYAGRRNSIGPLYKALYEALKALINSIHLPAFMASLEYKYTERK